MAFFVPDAEGIIDLLSRLSSYLTLREHIVSNGAVSPSPRPSTSFVIQGGAIGPLLFLTYINVPLNSMSHGVAFLCTDDIKIVHLFKPNVVSTAVREICVNLLALDD